MDPQSHNPLPLELSHGRREQQDNVFSPNDNTLFVTETLSSHWKKSQRGLEQLHVRNERPLAVVRQTAGNS